MKLTTSVSGHVKTSPRSFMLSSINMATGIKIKESSTNYLRLGENNQIQIVPLKSVPRREKLCYIFREWLFIKNTI